MNITYVLRAFLFPGKTLASSAWTNVTNVVAAVASASGDAGPGLERQRIWAGRGSSSGCDGHHQAGGGFSLARRP